jgi:hypothetical protein
VRTGLDIAPRSAELRFGKVRRELPVHADSEIGAPNKTDVASRYCQLREGGASFGRNGGDMLYRKPPRAFQWLVNLKGKLWARNLVNKP